MELKNEYQQEEIAPRLTKLSFVMIGILVLIFLRLAFLQGIRGNFYHFFSEENSIREIRQPAARGVVKDRHGVILADNRAAFDLVIIPQYVVNPDAVLKTLQGHFQMPMEELQKIWKKRLRQPAFQPIPIMEDVSLDVVAWIKAHQNPWGILSRSNDLRGVDIHLRFERDYPDGELASHVLGYVREVDAKKLKELKEERPGRYRAGDRIGVSGLESIWDEKIRGEDGTIQKVVNAVGREVSSSGMEGDLIHRQAVHGPHLQLTIDAQLQKKASSYLAGKTGAVVALDPNSGASLVFFSAPSYDLNLMTGNQRQSYWQMIAMSPKKYLLNRAIQGTYPSGSVYKIVTSLAAWGEKVLPAFQGVYCDGSVWFGSRNFHCWNKKGHGQVDFNRALAVSCDSFFYNLGIKLGVDKLAKYATLLGLGTKTGIGLPNEKKGLVPTREWKKRVYNQPWYDGENLSIAIGQGPNL
ncbi:MAG: penicillin-binding protein 2, partial [Deltaproteobacteria bacterium]|nr:penicillin-binding protein 2 [Deltaproteobacteria bacterium]